MKTLIFAVIFLFSAAAFAECDLCKKADRQVKAWDKAKTKDQKQKASKTSHALLQRLALGIHSGDQTLIAPTVKVLGAIYALDFDPLHEELENFAADLKQPDFAKAFLAEVDKLPADQKEKLTLGLEVRKQGPDPDDEPTDKNDPE